MRANSRWLVAIRSALCLAPALAACSSSSASPVVDGGHVEAAIPDSASDDDSSTGVTCPSPASGLSLPSGECSGGGTCAFELDDVCGPGIKFVDGIPPIYDCACESGTWACTFASGGLGLLPCPGTDDAGAPDAAAKTDAAKDSGPDVTSGGGGDSGPDASAAKDAGTSG
jgi:hypothetical protein